MKVEDWLNTKSKYAELLRCKDICQVLTSFADVAAEAVDRMLGINKETGVGVNQPH